ncbi:hypothetical protein EBR66_00485 [bacterium]|nr:hypothetical protein [bacterium]
MKKILLSVLIVLPFLYSPSAHALPVPTPDTTAPTITAPADQTFATSTFPASPLLVPATATDDTDPNPTVTYSPTTFPVGTTTVTWTATDVSGNSTTTSSLVIIVDNTPPVPTPETVTLTIRGSSQTVGPVTLTLPGTTTPDVSITPTGTTTTYNVPARSVLALLSSLDTTDSSFAVSDLQYYPSFSSFLLNCITFTATTSPDCNNWTYAVNNTFPSVGIDSYTVSGNDTVYLIFGSPWQVTTSVSSIQTGQSVTITAKRYDPATGTYVPAPNEVVGVVQFDSNFIATEFATSTTDTNGVATVIVNIAGTYAAGIQNTGYFPNTPLMVSQATGGGGTPAGTSGPKVFDVPGALAFLSSKQKQNGSFGSLLYSDWAAIGIAANRGPTDAIKAFMLNPQPDSDFGSVTDYMRHAMALMALGIDPYKGSTRNVIKPIIAAFDGTQIGDPSLVNDDIFGLIVLEHAGYTQNDDIIQKVAAFVLSKQSPNGSWENSPDVTAAATQALGALFAVPGVNRGLGKSIGYLKSVQNSDGGWGNIDSTSWVMTALNSFSEAHASPESAWKTSTGALPKDALAAAQQPDGGVRPTTDSVDNRLWSTSYALTAASGRSWITVLQTFPIPVAVGGGGTPVSSTSPVITMATSTTTSTIVTANLAIATTSPEDATSTPLVGAASSTSSVASSTNLVIPKKIGKKLAVQKKLKVVQTQPVASPETPPLEQTATAVNAVPDSFLSRITQWIRSWFSR